MSTWSPDVIDTRVRRERLSNWLALLALLAGGIVLPGAAQTIPTGASARSRQVAEDPGVLRPPATHRS